MKTNTSTLRDPTARIDRYLEGNPLQPHQTPKIVTPLVRSHRNTSIPSTTSRKPPVSPMTLPSDGSLRLHAPSEYRQSFPRWFSLFRSVDIIPLFSRYFSLFNLPTIPTLQICTTTNSRVEQVGTFNERKQAGPYPRSAPSFHFLFLF